MKRSISEVGQDTCIQLKPKGEIPKPDQSTSGIYYKAAYQNGLLKTFEKIGNGKSEYIFSYDYDDGRFLRHKIQKETL